MMVLSSVDPDLNRFREYVVDIQEGLFDTWTVFIHWGRIGSKGQDLEYLFYSLSEALAKVKSIVRVRVNHRYVVIGLGQYFKQLECFPLFK